MKNFKRGFTLIELLVVIAIVGILSAIILVSMNNSKLKGNRAAFMKEAGSAQSGFLLACDSGPVTVPSASSNITWTVGGSDSCGQTGTAFFCEKAVNNKAFVSTAVGAAIVYVGNGGLYTNATCTTPITGTTFP